MPLPTALTSLSPREAIADAIYRCVRGIDSNDRTLFESACLKTESMTIAVGPTVVQGWVAISEFFERVFHIVTTHVISNIRVEVPDGVDTASLTAHAISYHMREEDALKVEDTSYTASSLYDIELVRDESDGLWKIKKWGFQILWTTGDRAVLHG
ncbi:uncharacterized protein N0V89_010613 [Didymosphaeria variabile]|uniref:SnoaL-like domain-containing protein n=1 Tax=Didymosphaeria variabile TaxID=1932322 RepID=A0A9W8XD86_9PLEO|nr:uncharacterized protein N0V89_010613 [Didymosphaeria variabile]KAJ4346682.1 hypothetical protein N0V89_010613 [Didymosphaeria variabile]